MKKTKAIAIVAVLAILVTVIFNCIIVNSVNADNKVTVTRDVYSNNGSMKFVFKGLSLDTTHEYEFGLTKTIAQEVEKWFAITVYTETSATVDISTTTTELKKIINSTDTGYITIKDKTKDSIVLQPTAVNLKTPFLQVSNYTVIPNGKDLYHSYIEIALRKSGSAYYQYEKITDTTVINKFKELKASNRDYLELQDMLKQVAPISNWQKWEHWNQYSGQGYTQSKVSVPDNGLYYMWLYFSGDNLKPFYGCILVDNLEPDVKLESISLPSTKTIELGKTLTLTPTFTPSNTTEKNVVWKSSNEAVATVDDSGKITTKKYGISIITATSKENGNKRAYCTVTVTSGLDPKNVINYPMLIINGSRNIFYCRF